MLHVPDGHKQTTENNQCGATKYAKLRLRVRLPVFTSGRFGTNQFSVDYGQVRLLCHVDSRYWRQKDLLKLTMKRVGYWISEKKSKKLNFEEHKPLFR